MNYCQLEGKYLIKHFFKKKGKRKTYEMYSSLKEQVQLPLVEMKRSCLPSVDKHISNRKQAQNKTKP